MCVREREKTLELKLRPLRESANPGVLCSMVTHMCTEMWKVTIVLVCACVCEREREDA